MAMNTAANISAFVNTIYEAAWLVARDNSLMPALVTGFADASGTAIRQASTYGTANIQSVGETDDLSSQTFSPSSTSTLSPLEYGAQFFISDLRVETDPFQVVRDASTELGAAFAQSVDTNLVGLFDDVTGGTVGAAGSAMSWGYFYAALSRLRAQNAPGPYYFVCHPHQWHQLGKAASVGSSASTNAADELKSDINRSYWVGQVSGVQCFTSANISQDGSDDSYACMFSPLSMALDVRRAMRVEYERDASRRGWELNLSAVYAFGTWRPTFGIQVLTDAAAPTI